MNKSDIIEHIAKSAEVSKSAAERAIDAMVVAVKSSLRKGDSVTLAGFGSFYVAERAARTGRNPRTGAEIQIGAARIPRFRAGKALKDAIN
jgi:DNA-binding protein HU-beta